MSIPSANSLAPRQVAAWRNALFGIFAISGIGWASLMARMPAIKDALDVSTSQIGMLIFGIAVAARVSAVATIGYLAFLAGPPLAPFPTPRASLVI